MKKFLLLGLGTVLALSANAQFTSGGAAGESESTPRTSLAEQMSQSRNVSYSDKSSTSNYSGRFGLGYNMWSTMPSQGDGANYNGVYLEWLDAVSCSKSIPLYFDWGFNLNYNYRKDETESTKVTSNLFQIAVPLQVEYRLPVGEKVHISPYLGLIARVNILGSGTSEYETVGYTSGSKYSAPRSYTKKESKDINYFDKDDMGSSEACWKRFQLGWNIGVNFDFNKFYIGLSYGTDFMEIAKKCHSGTFKVGIGVAY